MSITVPGLSADRPPLTSWSTPTDVLTTSRTTPSPSLSPTARPRLRLRLPRLRRRLDPAPQRWSTWLSVEPLSRGPEPRPDWVVTSQGAIDTELGILKTGKEADVFLVERADPADPDAGVVMAAKRYRSSEHRTFHRAAAYTEGRSTKRSRDERALDRKSTWGKVVAAGEWAVSEWDALSASTPSGCRSPTRCRSTAPRS